MCGWLKLNKKNCVGKIKNTEGSAMSVGLLVVRLKYGLYVVHLSKWFVNVLKFKFWSSVSMLQCRFTIGYNGSACLRSAFQTCLKKAWEQTKGILQTRSWTKFATQQSLQNACGNAEPLDKIRQFEERCKRANCRCGANFVQRFRALRSGGFRSTKIQFITKVH